MTWESFCPFSAILSLARAEEIEKEFLERLDEIIQHSDRGREKIRRLGSCECEEIVESVFVPLARHCMALGEYARALYYLLECAAAYLHLSNNYMVSYFVPSVPTPMCVHVLSFGLPLTCLHFSRIARFHLGTHGL